MFRETLDSERMFALYLHQRRYQPSDEGMAGPKFRWSHIYIFAYMYIYITNMAKYSV